MTIELLELAHGALGKLVDEVVFVGGATVALWITDPAAPPVRVTEDVDVIRGGHQEKCLLQVRAESPRGGLPRGGARDLPLASRRQRSRA
jgi:hypothetical protein